VFSWQSFSLEKLNLNRFKLHSKKMPEGRAAKNLNGSGFWIYSDQELI